MLLTRLVIWIAPNIKKDSSCVSTLRTLLGNRENLIVGVLDVMGNDAPNQVPESLRWTVGDTRFKPMFLVRPSGSFIHKLNSPCSDSLLEQLSAMAHSPGASIVHETGETS